MKIQVTKEDIIKLLPMFSSDVGFQTALIDLMLEQMPTIYCDNLVSYLYFSRIHTGEYWVVVDNDSLSAKYLRTMKEVKDYLLERYKFKATPKFFDRVTPSFNKPLFTVERRRND